MAMLSHAVMFAGMYAITVTLFTVETGSFVKGLLVGLLAASLKTIWAMAHHKTFKHVGKKEWENGQY